MDGIQMAVLFFIAFMEGHHTTHAHLDFYVSMHCIQKQM